MIRAFQWDLGRQVERLDWLLARLQRYADWGYTELYLHLEDAVEFPSLPSVARRDAYSRRQFGRLVDAASRAGIGVVPIVNLLGHTQYLIKVPELRDLNELRAPDGSALERGQVCPLHPRFLEVADALIGDMAPFCTAGRLHVGLDESFHLGRHPLSQEEIARIGVAAHFAGHVSRLESLVRARGLRLGMWADMLALIPEAIPLLPAGISAYDWYYYPFGSQPRMELHNFAPYDLSGALKARGIEYWGCPMNGSFRYEPMPVFGERLANIRDWWRRCRQTQAAGMLLTSWEPNRLAAELTVLVDAAAATLWLEPGHEDAPGMLERGFARLYGPARARERSREALACDERAYAGNWRWEVNDRWDTSDLRRGTARYEAERGFFSRLASRGAALPRAFRASVAFRRYLAERDVFIRAGAAAVLSLRGRLETHGPGDPSLRRRLHSLAAHAADFRAVARNGAASARALWALSRSRRTRGPNEEMVAADIERLRRLRRWLARCLGDPARLADANPFCGAWQLQFEAVLEEPAVQRIVVEEHTAGGWVERHARTLIEFRAAAARPRARIRREIRSCVDGPDTPLRIALRGVGRASVANVILTDGVSAWEPSALGPREKAPLGEPAPSHGLPRLDWAENRGVLLLGPWKAKRRPR